MSDDELTPEQRFAAPEPDEWVPRDLARGRSRAEIYDQLIKLDWTPAAANALIDGAVSDLERYANSPESRRQLTREGRRDILGGSIIAAMGLMLFTGSILMSAGGIGFLLIPWGMVGVGLVIAGRGYTRWRVFSRDDLFPPPDDQAPRSK